MTGNYCELCFQPYMDRVMRQRIFGHMRTAKAQISLRIRAVWSGPSLSANKLIGKEMYEWRAKARMILCARAGYSESAHSAHVRRHFFAWRSIVIPFASCWVEWKLIDKISRDVTLSKLLYLPFEKGSTLKGWEQILYFYSRPVSEGTWCAESNKESSPTIIDDVYTTSH